MVSVEKFRELFWESDEFYNRIAEASGLPSSEFLTLYCLANGICVQSEISKKLYIPKQTINSAVGHLKKVGFVTADSSSENAKTKKLLLTEKGKQFVIDKVLLNDRIEDEVWSLLTEEEQKTLVALTKKYNGFLLETTKKYIP